MNDALVICNRYVAANLAHQGAKLPSPVKRREFARWVEQLEYDVFKLPRPDLHVWLDMPVAIACELLGRKGARGYLQRQPDIHESNRAHLEATRETYAELARRSPDWLGVECAPRGQLLAPEEIAEKVWEGVSRLLDHKG
jgi:dTMP kinase